MQGIERFSDRSLQAPSPKTHPALLSTLVILWPSDFLLIKILGNPVNYVRNYI